MDRKEAIEVLRKYSPKDAELREALETAVPELKESIDERIKKVIKQVLDESTTEKDECYLDNGVTQQEVFAWLEKQGSQNLANSAKTCKVEPKFKVGDWVVNTITKEVEQVIELTGCEYICSGHLIISFNEQHLLKDGLSKMQRMVICLQMIR